MDLQKLKEPFDENVVEWRLTRSGAGNGGIWAYAVPYITARAVYDRLNAAVGAANWQTEFTVTDKGAVCRIGIRHDTPASNTWIWKSGGADPTDFEPFKGMLSTAEKRAAVPWGIGRYLYDVEETRVNTSKDARPGWEWGKTKDGQQFYWERPKLPGTSATGKPPAPEHQPATHNHKPEPSQGPAPAPAGKAGKPAAQGAKLEPCRGCGAETADPCGFCQGCLTSQLSLVGKIISVTEGKKRADWTKWDIKYILDGFGQELIISTFSDAVAQAAQALVGLNCKIYYDVNGKFKNFLKAVPV